MESKKRLRRTTIWKRSNRSHRTQWKKDASNNNNDNNAEMGSSSKWESLNRDLLLDIFSLFKPLFLISTVSLVCRSWGRVCFDHLFGEDGDNTLDFTILNCDCCRRLFGSKVTPFKKAFLMKFLRGVMDVYRRDDEDGIRVTSITRMVFSSGLLQLTDHHLLYLAERSPELRELSLPFWRNIKHEGFSRAIRYWNGMEEMSIGPVICNNDIFHIIEVIGINCKQIEALELLGLVLTQQLSPEIAKSLNGLKLLRLEMVPISKVSLKNFLSKCKKLQNVEIWHCLTLEGTESNFLASCGIKKTEMNGVTKWSLRRDAEQYDMKNLQNFLWQ
ncbi:hypothetical protein CsSME_00030862 [Camellia sinensis var. sinensis]